MDFAIQDDNGAHDKFLKVNRAYEVLKDEELRKKYDEHGEAGLKDDFQGGSRYESWKFYQQSFGKLSLQFSILRLAFTLVLLKLLVFYYQ